MNSISDIDSKLEEINKIILEASNTKNVDKIRIAIKELKDVINFINTYIKDELSNIEEGAKEEFLMSYQTIDNVLKINQLLTKVLEKFDQPFDKGLNKNKLIENELIENELIENELIELDKEIEELSQILELISDIPEENEEYYGRDDIEEDLEKLENLLPEDENDLSYIEEGDFNEDLEELNLDEIEDQRLRKIMKKLNESIDNDDDSGVLENLSNLNEYLESENEKIINEIKKYENEEVD